MMLDCDVARTRINYIRVMDDTVKILGFVLAPVSQAVATTRRDPNDGDRGWTVVEVVCHLRDYDLIFQQRAQLMLEQVYPDLPGYDHVQLARERNYNSQELSRVYTELAASRARFVAFFRGLTDDQWQRAGVHPERGRFTMHDALLQVGQHDVLHLEQITRILGG